MQVFVKCRINLLQQKMLERVQVVGNKMNLSKLFLNDIEENEKENLRKHMLIDNLR